MTTRCRAAAALSPILLLMGLGCRAPVVEEEAPEVPSPTRIEAPTISPEAPEVILLFPGRDGLLHPERHRLDLPLDGPERVQGLLRALLAGPESETLAAPLPMSVEVGPVVFDRSGVAVVDLRAADGAQPPATGSQVELLTVYSLVNTVLANAEELKAVVLLWNGAQRPTMSGHVDTGHPLTVNKRLVADGS